MPLTWAFPDNDGSPPSGGRDEIHVIRAKGNIMLLATTTVEDVDRFLEVFGTKGAEDCRFLWPPDGDAAFREGMRLQAEGFVDAVQGRKSEGATAAEAVAALVAAEQAAAAFSRATR